jgi:site-specific DNA recombinase
MNVILYCRVSSDEQKKTGHSPQDQEEKLTSWAERKGYNAVFLFQEDYSGKTFNRPEWNKLMELVKRHPEVDGIFFTKWSRFGRNIEESYRHIRILRNKGIVVNAIEEWIDFEQSNSKFMLALYITQAEVDNDNRSRDVTDGMRRAVKDGNWASTAPVGYDNKRDEKGRAYIDVNEAEAVCVRKMFEMMATGCYTVEQCRTEIRAQGLKISKSRFHLMLRNPVYMGKILLKAYKKEPEKLYDGRHTPLITADLFFSVQDVLAGRKRKMHTDSDRYPLKGVLICPGCGDMVRGSESKGKLGGKYAYYHCSRTACHHRHAAGVAEGKLMELIRKLKGDRDTQEIFALVLEDVLKKKTGSMTTDLRSLRAKAEELRTRIATLEDRFIDGSIDSTAYQSIRTRYQGDLNEATGEISKLNSIAAMNRTHLKWCNSFIDALDDIYSKASTRVKRLILGSIFPEKLEFTGSIYRTPRINSILAMYLPSTLGVPGLLEIKTASKMEAVPYGAPEGTIIELDLLALYNLQKYITIAA